MKTAVSMYAIIGVCQQDATLVSDEQVERKIASAHGGVHAVYASDFEAPFLASSRTYYRAKAEAWMGSDSTPVYLEKVRGGDHVEEARACRHWQIHTALTHETDIHAVSLQIVISPDLWVS